MLVTGGPSCHEYGNWCFVPEPKCNCKIVARKKRANSAKLLGQTVPLAVKLRLDQQSVARAAEQYFGIN